MCAFTTSSTDAPPSMLWMSMYSGIAGAPSIASGVLRPTVRIGAGRRIGNVSLPLPHRLPTFAAALGVARTVTLLGPRLGPGRLDLAVAGRRAGHQILQQHAGRLGDGLHGGVE